MKRNNLTAAVLAGLAGIAGIAGTAQAVNINPDGLGQVLIYSYYTTNDGNQTILSVVNTTDTVKAVKVRFLEGFNSREVLDFNLYLSPEDVWVAAISDVGGVPTLTVPDNSCTVPYLYGNGGTQAFLDFAYSDDNDDGGPSGISRASEGYFEMIEMGTVDPDGEGGRSSGEEDGWFDSYIGDDEEDPGRMDNATAATHVLGEDGSEMPADCGQLVRNWTEYESDALKTDPFDGMWVDIALANDDCLEDNDAIDDNQDDTDCKTIWLESASNDSGTDAVNFVTRNRGGLFGGAAIINAANGTMFSYDAKAIQGYDETLDGVHFIPGTIHPSLNDGSEDDAVVFTEGGLLFFDYDDVDGRSIDAISATMMHDNVMNEFTIQEDLNAATEWVFTFPTKNFYVDPVLNKAAVTTWVPDGEGDPIGCNGWTDPEPFPGRTGPDATDLADSGFGSTEEDQEGWETCTYLKTVTEGSLAPFTELFGGDCEIIGFQSWDRNEVPTVDIFGTNPPVVSPAPPTPPSPDSVDFIMCNEVNVMRWGPQSIFGTTSDLLITVDNVHPNGWARMDFADDDSDGIPAHHDDLGLVGLPVIGFAAMQFENGFLGTAGASVLANYGGLFGHKSSVRRCELNSDEDLGDGVCESD